MNKSSIGKKTKVHKLTEAEYAAYISSLKSGEEAPAAPSAVETTSQENAKAAE